MTLHATRLLLLCAALTGCASAPAKPAAPDQFAGLPPLVCPEGASPRAHSWVRWCALPDKTRHGALQGVMQPGELWVELRFERGAPHGVWTGYWPNGKARWRATYAQGVLQGDVDQWYESGKQRCKLGFKDGQPHGWRVCWLEDGTRALAEQHKALDPSAPPNPKPTPPSTAPPSPQLQLYAKHISDMVKSRESALRLSFEITLNMSPPDGGNGKYVVSCHIGAAGFVTHCVALKPGPDPIINALIAREIELVQFRAPEGGYVIINKTFVFDVAPAPRRQ